MGEAGKSARVILIGLFLIAFLVGAIVILLLLIHKFGHNDGKDSEELHQIIREPLPLDIHPVHYFVELNLTSPWYLHSNHTSFHGGVKIMIETGSRRTKYLMVHARYLTPSDIKLFSYSGKHKGQTTAHSFTTPTTTTREGHVISPVSQLSLSRWFIYPSEDRIVLETDDELPLNSLLLLEIQFTGKLVSQGGRERNEEGLLHIRSGDKFFLASSGLKSPLEKHSRRIFPCFDDMRFLSIFSLTIHQPLSYSTYSNMPLLYNQIIGETMTSILATSVPLATRHVALIVGVLPTHLKFPATEVTTSGVGKIDIDTIADIEHCLTFGTVKGQSSMMSKHFIFPDDASDPEVATYGFFTSSKLMSPLNTAERFYRAYIGGVLRITSPNDTWILDGLVGLLKNYCYPEEVNKNKEMNEALATDSLVSDRVLNWNNLKLKQDEISYLKTKAVSVIMMLDSIVSHKNFISALKGLLDKRRKELEEVQESLKGLQINNYWYHKDEDERRHDMFLKWNSITKRKFSSTSSEEFLQELEKYEREPGKVRGALTSWAGNPTYPLLEVEFSGKTMTITQSRFLRLHDNYQKPNYTWEFQLFWNEQRETRSHWIARTETIVDNIDIDKDPIVVNPKRQVYARVNYKEDYWKLLFQRYNHLSMEDRINLIDDLMTLAQTGHVGYDLALDLLRNTKRDLNTGVWEEIERQLHYIANALVDTQAWNFWKIYIHKLVDKVFDDVSTKNYDSSYKRIIIKLACLYDYDKCPHLAEEVLKATSKPHPLADAIEEYLVKRGVKEALERARVSLQYENHQAAIIAYDVRYLDRCIEMVDGEQLERKSFLNIYHGASKYFDIKESLWIWFKDNINKLKRLFSDEDVADVFEWSVENFFNVSQIAGAQYVLTNEGLKFDEFQYLRITDKMDSNLYWRNRNYKQILDWLKSH